MIIVRNIFEDFDIRSNITNIWRRLDKFALKVFNQLLYNWKVSKLLVVNFLFSFLDNYFLIAVMKLILYY